MPGNSRGCCVEACCLAAPPLFIASAVSALLPIADSSRSSREVRKVPPIGDMLSGGFMLFLWAVANCSVA